MLMKVAVMVESVMESTMMNIIMDYPVMAIVEAAEMTAAMVVSAEMSSVPPALVAAPTVTATSQCVPARYGPQQNHEER